MPALLSAVPPETHPARTAAPQPGARRKLFDTSEPAQYTSESPRKEPRKREEEEVSPQTYFPRSLRLFNPAEAGYPFESMLPPNLDLPQYPKISDQSIAARLPDFKAQPSSISVGNMSKKRNRAQFDIFSLGTLSELKKLYGQKEKYQVRYLLDTEFKFWLATSGPSPAHYQMTGESPGNAKCIAAGDLVFNADFTQLIGINNRSGDFKPLFENIRWLIAALVINKDTLPFSIAEKLEIHEYAGISHQVTYEWTLDEMTAWINSFAIPQHALLGQQNHDKKVVDYSVQRDTSSTALSLS